MDDVLKKDPLAAYGLTTGQVRYITKAPKKDFEYIMDEVMNEKCEKCGCTTRDVGPLFAKDMKDDEGRKIVLMVCSNCLKNKKRTKK